jgi:hypothetical protein
MALLKIVIRWFLEVKYRSFKYIEKEKGKNGRKGKKGQKS